MTGFVVALIVAVIVIIGVALFVVRRRARDADVLPPPELSDPVDYTSLPVEEPLTFGDRVRAAPLALKLLAVLLLIGLIAVIGIAYYAFVQPNNIATTPAGPPPEITNASATVANERTIAVRANTNLPDGTNANVVLQENGQPFAWANPDTTSGTVQNGRLVASLERRADAPTPQPEQQYTVVINATGPNGQQVASESVPLVVPNTYHAAFFSGAVAEAPTAAPTSAPTVAPTNVPTAAPTTEPTAAPTATSAPAQTATVFNGGRIRSAPTLNANNQIGTINANETVQLLSKTADGVWYKITDERGTTGWVYNNLLRISPDVAAQVPVEGQEQGNTGATSGTSTPVSDSTATVAPTGLTATVSNGGRIRSAPTLNANNQIGTINANETVQLLAKTADGVWYKITDERGTTGWVYNNLLRVSPDVAAQVPVGS